jgi:hypothetical protein
MDLGCNSQLLVTGSCSFLITGIQKLGFRCLVSGVRSDDLRSCGKLHLTNAEVGLRPVGVIGAYAPEGMWNAEGWKRCALSFLK